MKHPHAVLRVYDGERGLGLRNGEYWRRVLGDFDQFLDLVGVFRAQPDSVAVKPTGASGASPTSASPPPATRAANLPSARTGVIAGRDESEADHLRKLTEL